MVTPPTDDGVALVCCTTTQGPWNVLVHHSWAPHGARRFLDLVESKYFDTTVPLMRCVRNFLCQFGLNGVPAAMKPFQKSIPDDPNWLPEGPEHRQNKDGVKRFQRGYMAYAGSGPKSRSLQLIVALRDNGHLAGGSPWEVPWGELVGKHSYETLDKIYTGYGEHGPKQASLWKANALEQVRKHFPDLDFVKGCRVVDAEGELGNRLSTRADYRSDKK
jgi:cyclophilin family peptidyl-prolyl cis-trans isomerase